jgi:transcription elongation factor GreA|tara:strand:- start:502 stop:1029 length:528 start_codon:yes stop_codon:yes gene_type:complete
MLDSLYFLEIQKHYLNRGNKMELEPVTSQGAAMLRNELKKCMEERPRVIQAIATARDFGDLAENAEYHSARERQSFLEGRIQELNARLSSIRVIDLSKVPTDFVRFGSKVTIIDIETDETLTYIIASDLETNPEQGWISYKCPLGKALMGKRVDDIIDFEHNGKEYEILKIEKVS